VQTTYSLSLTLRARCTVEDTIYLL